jgi:hypothetical protein
MENDVILCEYRFSFSMVGRILIGNVKQNFCAR